jgi:TetR/AcrR family transcriptional regulator, transcriptional repressor of aconitase
VPKVSEQHRARRRTEILEAARRCFARHGYEGATVARLEAESGLSRGAIFNYFGSKEDIFVALVEADQERLGRTWADEGYAAAVREIAAEDPAWLGVYIEATRRMRTDPEFAQRRREAGSSVRGVVEDWLERARESGEIRDDLPADAVGTFLGVVIDGLAVRAAAGLELPDLDAVLTLVGDATSGAAARERVR